jgi:Tfp pilus assembly protein PilX
VSETTDAQGGAFAAGASRRGPARADRRATRGMALMWAIFAVMVIAGIVVTGTRTFLAVDRLSSVDYSADGQARAVAEAGLVDAFAWFRRQQTQPVTSFAPIRNLAASPPVNETDDAAVGLVREYEIMPSLWGRYEVRKSIAAESFTDTDADGRFDDGEPFVDTSGNGRREGGRETRDVSAERGLPGLGTVWRIESHGFIFRRPDQTQPLGVGPNQRVAAVTVAAEVRRLTIVAPGVGALCSRTGSSISIGSRGRISGRTKTGVIYRSSTGSPVFSGGSEVTGTPASGTIATYLDSVQDVFGVTLAELKGMADASYASAMAFPPQIGDYTLNVVTGPITFDATRPLRGTGVVVVDGNCTLAANSNSFFNGVLYVKGNLVVRGPVYIRGTVVVTGSVDVAGSGGDYSEIDYDGSIITQVLVLLGQYRYATASYQPSPTLPDGTPDEEGLIRAQKTGRTLPGGNLPTALGDSLKPDGS